MPEDHSYEELVAEAVAAPFAGWDFSYLKGRVRDCELPWNFEELARAEITETTRLLDLDTGGGETLVEVLAAAGDNGRHPAHVVATESWAPNVPVARERLEPKGIAVRQSMPAVPLPADDAEFDLVLNRHGGCGASELQRVLAPGGVYLTQGVGGRNDLELNDALGGPAPTYAESATLEHAVIVHCESWTREFATKESSSCGTIARWFGPSAAERVERRVCCSW